MWLYVRNLQPGLPEGFDKARAVVGGWLNQNIKISGASPNPVINSGMATDNDKSYIMAEKRLQQKKMVILK